MPAARAQETSRTTTAAAIEAVWRIESTKLIASLSRQTGDVGLAEDMAQEALVTALELWPERGVPANPAAWLMTTARNRGIDRIRRDRVLQEKYGEIASEMEREAGSPESGEPTERATGDEVLTLLFMACHPALTTDAQVALTLKVLGGLSTEEVARALLIPRSTASQRVVRAKRTLTESGARFETPAEDEMSKRLATVLSVIYLIFNEGYSATAGDSWMRPDLCLEALRLGRMLEGLAPSEPEVHGLVALMELTSSRFPARTGPDGEPVLLLDQDRSRWDRLLIRRGLDRLELAMTLGDPGNYTLQASIAACHACARDPAETDWTRIVALYDSLLRLNDSPVTRLNRAMAVAMTGDTAGALRLVETLSDEPQLRGYAQLPAARGELLDRSGRFAEAEEEFMRAASLTRNSRERRALEARAARLKENS